MSDYSTINERIKELVDTFCNGNISAFAQKLGVSGSSVHDMIGTGRRTSKPSYDTLVKILETFDDVSAEWLMLGGNDMFLFSTATFQRSDIEGTPITNALLVEGIQKSPEYRALFDKMVADALEVVKNKISNDN